jgi:hypothetical protein
MSIKNELASYFAGFAKTVAVATVLGGGTMLLGAHQTNAVQDQRIEQLQRDNAALGGAVEKLNTSVQQLDKNVAVLNERMEK